MQQITDMTVPVTVQLQTCDITFCTMTLHHPLFVKVSLLYLQDTTLEQQVAQLSQRDRTAEWVSYGQNWKTETGRQSLRIV